MSEEKNVNVENQIEEPIEAKSETKQEKVFTEAEVNAIISKRLAKEKRKLDEAQRLASLSAEERAKEEFRLEKERFEEERKSFLSDKMLIQCEKELVRNDLPSEFAKLLVTDDADSTSENIKVFKEKWNSALDLAVNVKLAGRAPKIQSDDNKPKPGMSKEEFRKLSIAKQQEIYINDPELYKKLTER